MGLLAVFVPILQLVEQRLVTPTVGVVQKKGCNPRVLGGAALVLIAALPAAVLKMVAAAGGGGGGDGGGGGGGGVDVGGAFSTCCAKLSILFGRSVASGDMAKAKAVPLRSPQSHQTPKKSATHGLTKVSEFHAVLGESTTEVKMARGTPRGLQQQDAPHASPRKESPSRLECSRSRATAFV